MTDIVANLQNPSWWFTGIFFLFFGIFLKKLSNNWLPSLLTYLSKKIPFLLRSYARRTKCKQLKQIRAKRFDDVLIIKEIVKNYVFLSIFLLSTLILISAYAGFSVDFRIFENNAKSHEQPVLAIMLILSTPTYAFEWLYLRQNSQLKRLLNYRQKMRAARKLRQRD